MLKGIVAGDEAPRETDGVRLAKGFDLRERCGGLGGSRTHDLWLRKPTLYPAELQAHTARTLFDAQTGGKRFRGRVDALSVRR
jgi:hypothetical protein